HLLLEKSVGDLTAAQEEIVATAWNDCERLLKTLNSILDLARMESGKSQLDLKQTPAKRLVEESYYGYSDQAASKCHPFRMDVPDTLPLVFADLERIGLVFSNFLSNAFKYSYSNSEIVLAARTLNSDFVRFSVINSGPGLAEEEQARVFDKFYRIPGHKGEGAGLGLSIARQIVQAHDGRIGVLSELNKQTEFYFDLPVAKA
ncbi:MAG TPA: HAMP domain-containing sensor histidine kinase, partial [Chthoniobacterales bacterium]